MFAISFSFFCPQTNNILRSRDNQGFSQRLSAFAETILELIDIFQSGSEIVIDWFQNNEMIVNPDKIKIRQNKN